MRSAADVVIVGGGLGGSALATILARHGLEVLLLERTAEHRDRVRGEYLTPWGVAEAQKLSLYDDLVKGGAHTTKKLITLSEGVAPGTAQQNAIDLTNVLPGVPGGLCMQHVAMCNALNHTAVAAGATMLRAVERVEVAAGESPEVRFVHNGNQKQVRCRIVIGADGRGSSVLRQAQIAALKDPPHHLFSGLLVEGVENWPEDSQAIAVENDYVYFVFPQGGGRARLYLAHGREGPARFAGPGGSERFLRAFRLTSLPDRDALADARPAGPCHGYPNEDAWADEPVAPGVVLIGDAAGCNDPTIGQGLSITLRDVRLVNDILVNTSDWSRQSFRPYVEERRERMRRLRFVARLYAALQAEFGEEARARRQRAAERAAVDPTVTLPLHATLLGPDALPPEAFEPAAWDRLLG